MTQSAASTPALTPSFAIPIALMFGALPVLALQVYVGLGLFLFGFFLMIQAAIIRLVFAETALEVYRGSNLIRNFPYAEWRSWRIFWGVVPILFYFREVNSIHFLPILFNAKELRSALETKLGNLA
jgi:hypothetical protein